MRAIALGIWIAFILFYSAYGQEFVRSEAEIECSRQADEHGLHGQDRREFRTQCKANAGQSTQSTAPKQVQKPPAAVAATDGPFQEGLLRQAFELSKTCAKECANQTVNMVRLPIEQGKTGFLITTNDQDYCGSGGCQSLVVIASENKFLIVKEGQGITKNQATSIASGAGDPSSVVMGKPSFDCSKALSASARLICGDIELANADRMLGEKFRAAASKDEATKRQLIEQQVIWLRERNRRCGVGPDKATVPLEQLMTAKTCMLGSINIRIGELASPKSETSVAAQSAPTSTYDYRELLTGGSIPGISFNRGPFAACTPEVTGPYLDVRINTTEYFAERLTDAEFVTGLSKWLRQFEPNCPTKIINQIIDVWQLGSLSISSRDGGKSWNIDFRDFKKRVADRKLLRQQEQAQAQAILREQEAERQRQQQAAEYQRQQEIAQARIDAQSGDPLIGNWKSRSITLRITKNGNLYLVHMNQPGGMANGDFAGPYKDDQIMIGTPFGNIAVLQSKTQVLFAGETFTKAGQ